MCGCDGTVRSTAGEGAPLARLAAAAELAAAVSQWLADSRLSRVRGRLPPARCLLGTRPHVHTPTSAGYAFKFISFESISLRVGSYERRVCRLSSRVESAAWLRPNLVGRCVHVHRAEKLPIRRARLLARPRTRESERAREGERTAHKTDTRVHA